MLVRTGVELLVPQRDLGRRPPDQQHTASIAAGKTAPLHAAEHDAADGPALALLDARSSHDRGLALFDLERLACL
jgi:hypothetical protein